MTDKNDIEQKFWKALRSDTFHVSAKFWRYTVWRRATDTGFL